MIVSHKYKFIFIKTRKTASTSTEIALSQFCGEQDIITRLDPEDVALNEEYVKYAAQMGKNYHLPYSRYPVRKWGRLLCKGKRTFLKPHTSALEIRRLIGEKRWDSYFKFAVERNPWDRMISNFYYSMRKKKDHPTLDAFVSETLTNIRISNFYLYTINEQLAVDHLVRYENLDTELDQIAQRIGLPGKLRLPNAKGHYRQDRRHYREVYTPAARDMIQAACAKEIALLHYEF